MEDTLDHFDPLKVEALLIRQQGRYWIAPAHRGAVYALLDARDAYVKACEARTHWAREDYADWAQAKGERCLKLLAPLSVEEDPCLPWPVRIATLRSAATALLTYLEALPELSPSARQIRLPGWRLRIKR